MTNITPDSHSRSMPASRNHHHAGVAPIPIGQSATTALLINATGTALLLLVLLLLLLLPLVLNGQEREDPRALIDRVQKQYDRIDDYSVNIRADVDMKGFSVPEMTAKLYYKKPDRIHVESDGFAMLPRDAVAFRPTMFKDDLYDMVNQGKENIRGRECVKVRLFARSDTIRLQRVMLFVDPVRDLILRAEIDPEAGASVQVDITYTHADNRYWLPENIAVEMDSPRSFRRPSPGSPQKQKSTGSDKARITVRYSNYVVNRGIPDSVFEKKQK